jgi:hypothetical protein
MKIRKNAVKVIIASFIIVFTLLAIQVIEVVTREEVKVEHVSGFGF